MLNFLYLYLLGHLEGRGLVTTGHKLYAVIALLAAMLLASLIF